VLSLGTGLNPGEIAALFHHFRDSKH
jgi:hypothetical protein